MPAADLSRLETAWNDALNAAVAYFRALHSSSGSSSWRLVSVPQSTPATPAASVREPSKVNGAGAGSSGAGSKPSSLGRISPSDVVVHRRNGKGGEVFRATVEVDCGTDVNADTFRGCLATPETRPVCAFPVVEPVRPVDPSR